MAYKNIMVAFNGTDSSVAALKFAASLAGESAHVTAVLAHANYEVVNSRAAWVPASAQKIIEEANNEIIEKIEARFGEIKGTLNLDDRLHFKNIHGRVDSALAETARHFDIMISGVHLDTDDGHISLHPDRIALMSGRPVLIIPKSGAENSPAQNVAILWDGTRAATRALADGIALLEKGASVDLITLSNKPLPHGVEPAITQLERHNIKVSHTELNAQFQGVRALTEYCKANSPSLLIMGAYEHSKFREDFLGGLSSELLKNVEIPMMISH